MIKIALTISIFLCLLIQVSIAGFTNVNDLKITQADLEDRYQYDPNNPYGDDYDPSDPYGENHSKDRNENTDVSDTPPDR